MKEALGTIEVLGLTNGIVVADEMVKSANISVNDIEITRGFGYVTVKVVGDIGAVQAAINTGKAVAMRNDKLIACNVIARPAARIGQVFVKEEEKKEVKEVKEDKKIEDIKTKEVKEEKKVEEVKKELKEDGGQGKKKSQKKKADKDSKSKKN